MANAECPWLDKPERLEVYRVATGGLYSRHGTLRLAQAACVAANQEHDDKAGLSMRDPRWRRAFDIRPAKLKGATDADEA